MSRHRAGTLEEIRSKGKLIVDIGGTEIGIFLVGDQCYAYRNLCPHQAAPVCEGIVCGTTMPSDVYVYEYGRDQEVVRCPWHGWEFHLRTGVHLANQNLKLKNYPVEVENETIYVQL